MPDPVEPTDLTKAVRALIGALNDTAFGSGPGSYYLFINPKAPLNIAAGLTYVVDYGPGVAVIRPAD